MEELQTHCRYMNAGQDRARDRLAEQLVVATGGVSLARLRGPIANPCMSPGYLDNRTMQGTDVQLIGTGSYDECAALMPDLLHPDYECLQEPCAAMGVYQPALPTTRHAVVAYSAFFYTVNGIMPDVIGWSDASGVDGVPDVTPQMIVDAGRSFCSRPWSEVAGDFSGAYCFSSAYIPALLALYGVGLDSTQVSFSRKLHHYSVEWTLGAQLFYATEDSAEYHLASDDTTGTSECVPPGVTGGTAGGADGGDGGGTVGVGMLVIMCLFSVAVGATVMGTLGKKKEAVADSSGGEGIYQGGTL